MLALDLLNPRVAPALRHCPKCGADKPRGAFNASTVDGRSRAQCCKECVNAYNRTYYAANRAKLVDKARTDYETQKVAKPVEWMLERKRQKCARSGVAFDITADDIQIPEFCPVLGIRLSPVGAGDQVSAPSIDRIDSSRGYVRGNVAVISQRANRIKNDGTVAEHERIAQWMRERLDN